MPNGEPLLTVSGGATEFVDASTAGNSIITNEGAKVSGQIGGATNFQDTSDAGTATVTCNGGQVAGAHGGIVKFVESAKAGNATLIANGGLNGGDGGQIQIVGRPPQVASPRVEVFDNGELVTGMATIGSLEGTGIVDLGGTLSVGSNNLSTTFSGTIQDSGSLTKIGTGTLKITGNNTYTGYTTVSGGSLLFSNTATLATLFVEVDAGTLGGGVTIPSGVNVGGMGSQAFLAPAAGGRKQVTMTIQGELLMLEEGTYKCTFKARGSQVLSDQVKANTIVLLDSAPTITFKATIQGTLTPGTTFTVLNNTSTNPIDGTFSNLPDGGIVTIGSTTFQANYEGGDGNDLTLTVVQ
jgi:autotransporter-associated beta strand protein